jgi:hypothetical protein
MNNATLIHPRQNMTATDLQQTAQPEPHLRESVKALARDSNELIRQTGESARGSLKKPTTGAALVGATAMGAVLTFGLLPTAIAGAAGYVGYRLLRKRRAEEQTS